MKAEELYEALAEVSPAYLEESEAPAHRRAHRALPRAIAVAAAAALVGCVTALAVTLTLRDAAREDMGISAEQPISEWTEYDTGEADAAAGAAGSVQLAGTLCSGERLTAYLEVTPVSEEIAAELAPGGSYAWDVGSLDTAGGNGSVSVEHVAYDAAAQTALVRLQVEGEFLLDAEQVSFALALYDGLQPAAVYGAVEIPVTRSESLGSFASIPLTNGDASGTLWSIRVYAGYVELSVGVTPLSELTDGADSPDAIDAYFGSWLGAVERAADGAALNYVDGTSEVIAELASPYAGVWVAAGSIDDAVNGSLVVRHIVSNAIDLTKVESVTIGGVTYPLRAE